MSLAGQKIRVNGIHLNVFIEGEGAPVMLLHGFPDSNAVWRQVIPLLVEAGFQVIAPDQRGFGQSDAPQGKRHYQINTIASDAIGLLDSLGLQKCHVAGHDWGAVIGWLLAGAHADRVDRFAAISVGHPKAYARAGLEQKRKGWYVLAFQLRGIAEKALMANDWAMLRKSVGDYLEIDRWIGDLSRPGRLTAGLNWYRANFARLLLPRFPSAAAPVMGVWSDRDIALSEDQMINSARYVKASWRYERIEEVGHWLPLDAPDRLAGLLVDFFQQTDAD